MKQRADVSPNCSNLSCECNSKNLKNKIRQGPSVCRESGRTRFIWAEGRVALLTHLLPDWPLVFCFVSSFRTLIWLPRHLIIFTFHLPSGLFVQFHLRVASTLIPFISINFGWTKTFVFSQFQFWVVSVFLFFNLFYFPLLVGTRCSVGGFGCPRPPPFKVAIMAYGKRYSGRLTSQQTHIFCLLL